MMTVCLLLLSFFSLAWNVRGESSPFVLFPPALHLGRENFIYVTPLLHNQPNVDITLSIEEQDNQGNKLYQKTLENRPSRVTTKFGVSLPLNIPSSKLHVEVRVSGHDSFFSTINAAPDLRSIELRTDKVFYRPLERVVIRALALTHENQNYQNLVDFHLLDPNGFRIFNQSVQAPAEGFISVSFELPRYLRFGDWKVMAFAPNSPNKFETTIRVTDYSLPKYRVFLTIEETHESPFVVKSSVFARFAHGMVVNGEVTLYCSIANNRDATRRKRLLSAELRDGVWQGRVDIQNCVSSQESPPPKLQLIAEVTENGTFVGGSGSLEFDAFASGFEMVPLRPAYTERTTKIMVYFRLLSSLLSIRDSSIKVVSQCISSQKAFNGLNQSIIGQKLGTIVELNVDLRCDVYVIRARRQLANGYSSREEMIVLPSLLNQNFADFSLIQPANPLKEEYEEGDVIDVNVPPELSLNYLMSCNSKDLIAAGPVLSDFRILIPVTSKMIGTCVLYVYKTKERTFRLDMYLFFVAASFCPKEFSFKLSEKSISVFSPITAYLKAPSNSLALIHAFDSKLEGLLKTKLELARSTKHWTFAEFIKPDDKSITIWLSNLLKTSVLISEMKKVCSRAGKNAPQCPEKQYNSALSRFFNDCLREFKSACDNPKGNRDGHLVDKEKDKASPIVMLGIIGRFPASPKSSSPKEQPRTPAFEIESDLMEDVQLETSQPFQDLLVREFFPEVWLFDDYRIGGSGALEIPLQSPHSVTEWKFTSSFWAQGRASMCQAETRTVISSKNVFMDVDLPSHVYENETVQVRVTITAKVNRTSNMAVCFRGLSPVVCGDVGREGTLGEKDYTRVALNSGSSLQLKLFYVRFLREGLQNLSFELREETNLPGGDWHCRDEETRIFDRILKKVQVNKRVDLEEHYRQMVVYRTKRIPTQHLLTTSPMLITAPDVIYYSQRNEEDDSVLTEIRINSQEVVYNVDLEFSKFIPSFPSSLSSEIVGQGASSQRNKPKRHRLQRSLASNNDLVGSSYSLSNVLKELSSVVYELKTMKTMNRYVPASEIEQREISIGNLLSELLTFSDCSSKDESCGFGEFGKPFEQNDRSPLLTTLATSLLCEQGVSQEYVCGPLNFLAIVANRLSRMESFDLGYSIQVDFPTKEDEILFLQALLVSTVMDCSMYSCTQNFSDSWRKLHHDFYKVDENREYDLRTESALAYVSTPFTGILWRRKIANKASRDRLPFWDIVNGKQYRGVLDRTLLKSGNILANSLALLAYTSTDDLYRFWRMEFNFDDLTNWLVEEQSENRQFENAIDTYFGSRALFSYHLTQMPRGLNAPISGNVSINLAEYPNVRQFDSKDLPFSSSIPPATTAVHLQTKGDGRLLAGIRVITQRRRRSKRDPTDIYPVSIKLTQQRNPFNQSYINQTVTLILHSAMIKTLEMEHGLFTGFTASPENIQFFGTSIGVERPKISNTAIHFILKNLKKEEPAVYSVIVVEPSNNYSPENLAPIAISAICHSVMGRLIVLPSSLTFDSRMSSSSNDEGQIESNNIAQHPLLLRHKRQNGDEEGLAGGFISPAPLSYRLDDTTKSNGLAVATNLQTISAELVETVCLPNGVCTCAEGSCANLRCTNCSKLSFASLCKELNAPKRFGIIFRITNSRSSKMNTAEYSVFDVKVLDWYGDVKDAPDQLTIWLRNCNSQCVALTNVGNSTKPRFLLVGDAEGLFDGSREKSSEVASSLSPRLMSSTNQQAGITKSMLKTNYVMRDTDRLAKSTDCWPLFGKLQDEHC